MRPGTTPYVVALLVPLLSACADKSLAPGSRPAVARLELRASVAAQTSNARTIDLRASYLRTTGERVIVAQTQTAVSGGVQTVSLELDLTECLADATRTGSRTACTLQVSALLRSAGGAVLDSIGVAPFDAAPYASVPAMEVELVEVASVTLPYDTLTTVVGDTRGITPVVKDATGRTITRNVEYTVSDPSVASVSFGVVTFTGPGTVVITARNGAHSDTFEATVKLSFTTLFARNNAACALTKYGTAYCWGTGPIGSPTSGGQPATALVPSPLAGGQRFGALGFGDAHGCAANTGNVISCWGLNASGQLGTGNTAPSTVPVPISGALPWFDGAIGGNHMCALAGFGQAYCWGNNSAGQLGNNTTNNSLVPVNAVQGVRQFLTIAAGPQHTCGLTVSAFVNCWGANASGQLGQGNTVPLLTPNIITLFTVPFYDVQIGDGDNSCAVALADAALYCWGRNDLGQLGDGTTTNRADATLVSGGLQFADFMPGATHSCGVTPAGVGYCWGRGTNGELGTGFATSSPTPVPVAGNLTWVTIRPGESHTCGLTTTELVYCWGANSSGGASGMLGTGNGQNSLVPVKVAGQK